MVVALFERHPPVELSMELSSTSTVLSNAPWLTMAESAHLSNPLRVSDPSDSPIDEHPLTAQPLAPARTSIHILEHVATNYAAPRRTGQPAISHLRQHASEVEGFPALRSGKHVYAVTDRSADCDFTLIANGHVEYAAKQGRSRPRAYRGGFHAYTDRHHHEWRGCAAHTPSPHARDLKAVDRTIASPAVSASTHTADRRSAPLRAGSLCLQCHLPVNYLGTPRVELPNMAQPLVRAKPGARHGQLQASKHAVVLYSVSSELSTRSPLPILSSFALRSYCKAPSGEVVYRLDMCSPRRTSGPFWNLLKLNAETLDEL